jgi:tetratricopeptide (TPR) repeat protein
VDAFSLSDEVLEVLDGDVEYGEEKWGVSLFIWGLAKRGAFMLAYMGRLREAYRDIERALALARQREKDELLGWILGCCCGLLARWAEDPSSAVVQAQQSIEIAEKNGSPLSLSFALSGLGRALLASGNAGAAVEIIERAVALSREGRVQVNWLPWNLAGLADAHTAGGDADASREAADEAIALAQRIGTRVFEAEGWLSRAQALLASRGADARPDVEAALGRAESLIEETGGRSLQPHVHEQRVILAKLAGDAEACTRELREAHRLFTEIGATGHAERMAKELRL